MTELHELTASELLDVYQAGTATPVQAVESCLDRIDKLDSSINAIRLLRAGEALVEAAASAQRWEAGTAGPLDGVPFGLKDIIATAGVTTTGGSSLYRDYIPAETAAHAQRLMDAGAILLAKLETFEFACGGPHNRTFGPVHNPWDPERTTGGSSSGSGAAVASRMMPLAIGTDTGGSIRIPAAYCGLTGLKPTYGRVPRHGVMGLSWTLDHVGPMTRSALDAARMMAVIAGYDARDSASSTHGVPDYVGALGQATEPIVGQRIGRLRGWFEEGVAAEVLAAHDAALAQMAAIGYEVIDVEVPDMDLVTTAAWQVCYPETLSLHEANFGFIEDRDLMGAGLLAATPFVSAVDYLRAMRYRSVFQTLMGEAMKGCVALVLPGMDAPPPKLTSLESEEGLAAWLSTAVRLHIPFNFAGMPALCMPAGVVDGMPTSLQLVGMPHADAVLLAMAHRFQLATEFHLPAPPEVRASFAV